MFRPKKFVVPERIRAAGFTEQISPQRDDLTTNRQGLDNCSISNLPEIQRNFSIGEKHKHRTSVFPALKSLQVLVKNVCWPPGRQRQGAKAISRNPCTKCVPSPFDQDSGSSATLAATSCLTEAGSCCGNCYSELPSLYSPLLISVLGEALDSEERKITRATEAREMSPISGPPY